MKKSTIFGLMMATAIGLIFTSCKDDFTEEDALKAQQAIDLTIRAYDPFTNAGVSGATVTIIQDGKEVTQTTSDIGVALFKDVQIGDNIPVNVKKEGFTEMHKEVNINSNDFRQSSYTQTIPLFALDGPSTAIIRGNVEIETDVTNDKPEFPANQIITAYFNYDSWNNVAISSTIDANGNYELKVPASVQGQNITFVYPTIETNQTIYIGGYEGEPDFPNQTALPSKATIKTLFSPDNNVDASYVPDVEPLYALATAPTGTGAKHARLNVSVNNTTGAITGIFVNDGGKGYPVSSTSIDVVITSINGTNGTGVVAKATTDANGVITSVTVSSQGSGYPNDDSSLTNKTYSEDPSGFSSNVTVKPGTIKVMNLNYGTGLTPRKLIDFYN